MKKVPAVLAAMCTSVALADPGSLTIFTDFEDLVPNTPLGGSFGIGDATFSGVGNFAGVVGEGELYFSGVRAWMVQGEGLGRVDFAGGASLVEFWAIADPEASADAIITAFDSNGLAIGASQSVVVGDEFMLYSFAGDISYILFDHTAALNEPTGMISIDDFGFNPVPTPGAASILLIGGLLGARRRRNGR